MKFTIKKTPADNDNDDVVFENGKGYAYIGKDNGRIGLIKCPIPECLRENYAMTVTSGVCAWCGYDVQADR